MSNTSESKFFDKIFEDLYNYDEVLHHSNKDKSNKYNNIKEYLSTLESLSDKARFKKERIKLIKKLYRDKYVIRVEEIPAGYFEKVERERPKNTRVSDRHRKEIQEEVIEAQEKSLYAWIDYLLDDDTEMYPYWIKYWAFNGILKLGSFNHVESSFNIRNKNTVAPFACLNREALSLSIDMILKELNKDNVSEEDLKTIVNNNSFPRMYTYILKEVLDENVEIPKRNKGTWVKYGDSSSYSKLCKSLSGYNTGWGIAGEYASRALLSKGDIYVYYTLDKENEFRVPRMAIRTEKGKIVEIRGVGENQNLELDLEDEVALKLQEFPDKEVYNERVSDMDKLTEVYNKHKRGEELGLDELFFLYEVKDKIISFGYNDDPRIEEIRSERNTRKDIALIFGCSPEQVATSKDEITSISGVYFGDLKITKKDRIMKLPTVIWGNLDLDDFDTRPNMGMPEIVKGDFTMDNLGELDGFLLPRIVHGDLSLSEVVNARNIQFPDVGGNVYMGFLMSGENLYFNEYTGTISMQNLHDARSIQFPRDIKGYLMLNHFDLFDSIKLPDTVYSLIIGSPENSGTLKFPKEIKDNLIVDTISNIGEVILPESIGGFVSIHKIINCNNISFSRVTSNIFISGETIKTIDEFKTKAGIKQD